MASPPPPGAPRPPPPPPPATYQWIFFAPTSCSNRASVGDGSPPLKPPIAITLWPLASWSGAALIEPDVAAAHVWLPASVFSSATSDAFADSPAPAPPMPRRPSDAPLGGAPPDGGRWPT